jgi:hypothetical protein
MVTTMACLARAGSDCVAGDAVGVWAASDVETRASAMMAAKTRVAECIQEAPEWGIDAVKKG